MWTSVTAFGSGEAWRWSLEPLRTTQSLPRSCGIGLRASHVADHELVSINEAREDFISWRGERLLHERLSDKLGEVHGVFQAFKKVLCDICRR